MVTLEHILQAAKHAVDHPEEYDQSRWCGTACCVAGHARRIVNLPEVYGPLSACEFNAQTLQERMLQAMMVWLHSDTAKLMLLVDKDGVIRIPKGGVGAFGEGTTIDFGVRINQRVKVGKHVRIGAHAEIDTNARIGDRAVIGYCALIGASVHISRDVEIGDHADIGWGTSIGPGARIEPSKVIPPEVAIGLDPDDDEDTVTVSGG